MRTLTVTWSCILRTWHCPLFYLRSLESTAQFLQDAWGCHAITAITLCKERKKRQDGMCGRPRAMNIISPGTTERGGPQRKSLLPLELPWDKGRKGTFFGRSPKRRSCLSGVTFIVGERRSVSRHIFLVTHKEDSSFIMHTHTHAYLWQKREKRQNCQVQQRRGKNAAPHLFFFGAKRESSFSYKYARVFYCP